MPIGFEDCSKFLFATFGGEANPDFGRGFISPNAFDDRCKNMLALGDFVLGEADMNLEVLFPGKFTSF